MKNPKVFEKYETLRFSLAPVSILADMKASIKVRVALIRGKCTGRDHIYPWMSFLHTKSTFSNRSNLLNLEHCQLLLPPSPLLPIPTKVSNIVHISNHFYLSRRNRARYSAFHEDGTIRDSGGPPQYFIKARSQIPSSTIIWCHRLQTNPILGYQK